MAEGEFFRHAGNADVIRQELSGQGIVVFRRTVERAVKAHRDELCRKKVAAIRFDTSLGHQMQADFGEKHVLIGGERIKAHLYAARLGHDNASSLEKHYNCSIGELDLNEKNKSFSQYRGFLPGSV